MGRLFDVRIPFTFNSDSKRTSTHKLSPQTHFIRFLTPLSANSTYILAVGLRLSSLLHKIDGVIVLLLDIIWRDLLQGVTSASRLWDFSSRPYYDCWE